MLLRQYLLKKPVNFWLYMVPLQKLWQRLKLVR